MKNIEKLISALPCGRAYIIEDPLNLRYLTGSTIDTAKLVICGKNAYFLTDFRYIEVAQQQFDGSGVHVIMPDGVVAEIRRILDENGVDAIEVESGYQQLARLEFFRKITHNIVYGGTLDKALSGLRLIKDEYGIESTRAAQAIADASFSNILNFIKPGKTEREIALEIEFYMRSNGAEAVSFETIAVSGKNSSLPHGIPSDKPVCDGDFITMDFGCKVNGYCSDMTRTVAVGHATDKMLEVYNTVLTAQKTALTEICAGKKCSDVDKTARDIIYNAGYEGKFGHSTGHGTGLFIHEAPALSERSVDVLRSGMIVTCEPGIYLPDEFGVRIEDMVVVTETGCDNLAHSPKDLIILQG